MKKRQRLIASMASVMLMATACEKKVSEETTEPTEAAATTTAPVVPETNQGSAPDDGGDACKAAYADTVKLVEAMKETMKRTGKEGEEEDDYQVPAKADYLTLCGKLPADMQRCLVLEHAMQNKEACQKAQDGLSGEAKTAYAELMGK